MQNSGDNNNNNRNNSHPSVQGLEPNANFRVVEIDEDGNEIAELSRSSRNQNKLFLDEAELKQLVPLLREFLQNLSNNVPAIEESKEFREVTEITNEMEVKEAKVKTGLLARLKNALSSLWKEVKIAFDKNHPKNLEAQKALLRSKIDKTHDQYSEDSANLTRKYVEARGNLADKNSKTLTELQAKFDAVNERISKIQGKAEAAPQQNPQRALEGEQRLAIGQKPEAKKTREQGTQTSTPGEQGARKGREQGAQTHPQMALKGHQSPAMEGAPHRPAITQLERAKNAISMPWKTEDQGTHKEPQRPAIEGAPQRLAIKQKSQEQGSRETREQGTQAGFPDFSFAGRKQSSQNNETESKSATGGYAKRLRDGPNHKNTDQNRGR